MIGRREEFLSYIAAGAGAWRLVQGSLGRDSVCTRRDLPVRNDHQMV